MPNMMVLIKSLNPGATATSMILNCGARCNGMSDSFPTVEFEVTLNFADSPAAMNSAISTAAIAALGAIGFVIGIPDRKNLIGDIGGL